MVELVLLIWGEGANFILGAIPLWNVVFPSPKIVIKLPRTYEKLPCKGEPNRFSGKRSFGTNKQTDKTDILILKKY